MKTFSLAILALLVAGCATTKPATEKTVNPRHQEIVNRGGDILLVTDFCIYRDNAVNQDHFLIRETLQTGEWLQGSIANYLENRHLRIKAIQMPFACGSMQVADAEAEIYAAEHVEAEPVAMTPPFHVAEAYRSDHDHRQALQTLLVHYDKQIFTDGKSEEEVRQARQQNVSRELALLRQRHGVDGALFLTAGGAQVSGAKTFTSGFLTTALSLALSAGTYVYMSASVSATNLGASLVDLNSGAVLWSKRQQVGVDPTALSTYTTTDWKGDLLAEMMEVGTPATQTPAPTTAEQQPAASQAPTVAMETTADPQPEPASVEAGPEQVPEPLAPVAGKVPAEPPPPAAEPEVRTSAAQAGMSVDEQLEALKQRRMNGELTGEEYLAERQRIIDG